MRNKVIKENSRCFNCNQTERKVKEVKGLFSSSGIKTPLNKVSLLGDILF